MNKSYIKGVHHVAIICSDYKKTKTFYTKILGLEIISENYRQERDSYKLDLQLLDGTQLEIFSFPDRPKRPSYPEAQGLRHLAFLVDSVEEVSRYLKSNMIEVEDIRVDEHTGKKFTFFNDPDNLPLELYEA
ncbi:VOC family protein [Pseudoalteromonas sp. C2R02]|uniref:SMU1112c/YaeR family gloxylase I-like metalloprotein n=1 Tax=Pseudoalteromonas sp. C2R02 TaxID=2841565 RepID=UPI0020917B94|nr:VOC family protein [Pseudoalteromonas sp. C2R02]